MDSIPAGAWAALTAIAGALIGWLTSRPKAKADAAGVLTSSALAIVQELQEEVALLRIQVADCQEAYAEVLIQNHDLLDRINELTD